MKKENNEINQWQTDEINTAVQEADAGDFATEQELQAVIEKWRASPGAV